MFQNHKGDWWSGYFGSDHSVPWWEQFGLIALRVEKLPGGLPAAQGTAQAGDSCLDVEDNSGEYPKQITGGSEIAKVKTVLETLPEGEK